MLQRPDCVCSPYKEQKRIVNNFVNILAKDHRAQNLFRSQTHALNGFAIAYIVKTKFEQIANVHEMFTIYALETYCPRNQKKLTF